VNEWEREKRFTDWWNKHSLEPFDAVDETSVATESDVKDLFLGLTSELETMKGELSSWTDKATEFGMRAEAAERETVFVRQTLDKCKKEIEQLKERLADPLTSPMEGVVVENLRTEAYNQKGLAQKWEAENTRLEAERSGYYKTCQKYRETIEGLEKEIEGLQRGISGMGASCDSLRSEVERLKSDDMIIQHRAFNDELVSQLDAAREALIKISGG
jgi:chromosome segregation ATPase